MTKSDKKWEGAFNYNVIFIFELLKVGRKWWEVGNEKVVKLKVIESDWKRDHKSDGKWDCEKWYKSGHVTFTHLSSLFIT